MAVYLAFTAAVFAGIGFGIVVGFSIRLRNLAPRRFFVLSVLAGAAALALNFAGALMPYLYYYGNRLGMMGGILAVLAPGMALGLVLVASMRIASGMKYSD